jgi:hypothetical protein
VFECPLRNQPDLPAAGNLPAIMWQLDSAAELPSLVESFCVGMVRHRQDVISGRRSSRCVETTHRLSSQSRALRALVAGHPASYLLHLRLRVRLRGGSRLREMGGVLARWLPISSVGARIGIEPADYWGSGSCLSTSTKPSARRRAAAQRACFSRSGACPMASGWLERRTRLI